VKKTTEKHRLNGASNPRGRKMPNQTTARGDAGQAILELALLMPIFVLLIVGAAEFGHLAYAAIEVTNAARAGCAYGSQTHITASDNANIQLAAIQDGSNISGLTATPSHFCACSTGGTIACSTALTSCPSPARIIEYVQVNTAASVAPIFNYPGISKTFNLSGQAIMRVEQ
jgi:Flp pilus assembly protein TadG